LQFAYILKPIMKIFENLFKTFYLFIFIILPFLAFGQSSEISKKRAFLSSITNEYELINNMNNLGMLYQYKNIDSCLYFGLKAKELSIALKYPKGELDADNLIGVSLALRGLTQEALSKFNNVLDRYRKQHDFENEVQLLMNIANVYKKLNNNKESKSFFNQAIQLGSKLERDSILALVYVNYAGFNLMNNVDSLNYYLKKSKNIAKKYNNDWIFLQIRQLEAYELSRQNNQNALVVIKETLSRAKELNFESLEVNSLLLLGDYYARSPKIAINYYKQAYERSILIGDKLRLVSLISIILNMEYILGNKEEIIKVQKLFQNALIEENENLKKFIVDYVHYNSLETNNKILAINNKNQSNKIWILIAVLVFSIILVFYIFKQYRRTIILNKLVNEQNATLQNALESLEETQDENKRMMKIVAHDLRDPLGAIKMAATLIRNSKIDHAESNNLHDLIIQSADQSIGLVSDLLTSNLDARNLDKNVIDLQELLEYCVDILKHKSILKEQNILLESQSIEIIGNRGKLSRALSNLIANAIKFSPKGYTIEIRLEKKEQYICIAIIDKGIGIPEYMKGSIFQMFSDARQVGTEGEKTFGLGLSITKQIIEAHEGKIWFESSIGIGTTFWLELPVNPSGLN